MFNFDERYEEVFNDLTIKYGRQYALEVLELLIKHTELEKDHEKLGKDLGVLKEDFEFIKSRLKEKNRKMEELIQYYAGVHKITQKDVAKITGFSESKVSKLVNADKESKPLSTEIRKGCCVSKKVQEVLIVLGGFSVEDISAMKLKKIKDCFNLLIARKDTWFETTFNIYVPTFVISLKDYKEYIADKYESLNLIEKSFFMRWYGHILNSRLRDIKEEQLSNLLK